MTERKNIIIYNTSDGKAQVSLYAKDGMIWMNQNQLAELFTTSKQNVSKHIVNILKDNELDMNSVVKDYLTTEFKRFIDFFATFKRDIEKQIIKTIKTIKTMS